ncbi:hypothetical protein FGB62_126g06 [Gracilaria domingensis]|nr:hypothetical protein FGB62_126g06 [Gracilaria domingensis]
MPPPVLIAAAVCTPKLVANALFRDKLAGVVDVGAGNGHPITETALKRRAKWVLSFEESGEYKRLRRLRGTVFHHVRARPGNGAQHPTVLQALQAVNLTADAHNRHDPSARMYGTISLLSITLSSSHLVVEGASALLPSVQNVLLRVDVEDHAEDSLQVLFQSGFECAHLAFSNKRSSHPFFGRNSIDFESLPSFLRFLTKHGGVVDVLCSKRISI